MTSSGPDAARGDGDPEALGIEGIEVVALLGSGGQADVYWARDLDHGREVAVKVFRPEADPALFDRERKATGLLSSHEHVVHLHRSGTTTDGRPFLLMEYADAGTMTDHVFEWDRATALMIDVAAAVAVAHERGVIHRDIKPQNVLLFTTGGGLRAKLADFGIAAVPGTATTTTLRGTTAYAPPELLAHGQKTDERGDIFSLGATLFFGLTGEVPPFGAIPDAIRDRAAGSSFGGVWKVVAKATATEPGDRFQSAADFRRALADAYDALVAGHGNGSSTDATSSSTPGPPPGPPPAPRPSPTPSPPPAASSSTQGRGALHSVPFRLESTRNIAGLAGGLVTAGLALGGVFTQGTGLLLVPVGYVAAVLVSHALGHD